MMPFATLRSRIVALLIVSSVLLAGALAAVIGSRASDGVKQQIGASLAERARDLGERLDHEMATRLDEVRLLAGLDSFRSLDDPARIRRMIDRLQEAIPLFSWVGVLDPQGTVRAATGGVLEGKSIAQRPVFHEGIKGEFIGDVHDAVLLASLLPNPTGEPMKFVDIAVRLQDPAGRTTGVFAAHLSWNWAREVERAMLARLREQPTLELFVVSADGTILLAPNSDGHGHPLPLDAVRRAQAGESGWVLATWPDGDAYVTGYAPTRGRGAYQGLGWIVVARQPASDAFQPVVELVRYIALIGAAFALLAALIGWIAASSVVEPLRRIARAAETVRRSRGGRFAAVDGPSEIRAVSDAIEDLVDTVVARDEALAELKNRAARDPLTGLANRAALDAFLAGGGGRGRPFAFACVDLDGFKAVNDGHGHAAGDAVLRQVAERLGSCVRGGDLVIRNGGDEFVAILEMPQPTREGPVLRVGSRIVEEIAQPFPIDGGEVRIGASVGVAFYPQDADDPQQVLHYADQALYRAKRAGRRRVEVFNQQAFAGDD